MLHPWLAGVGRPCTMNLECTASGTHCNGTHCVCVESTSLWNDLCIPGYPSIRIHSIFLFLFLFLCSDQNALNESLVVHISKAPDTTGSVTKEVKLSSAAKASVTSTPKSSGIITTIASLYYYSSFFKFSSFSQLCANYKMSTPDSDRYDSKPIIMAQSFALVADELLMDGSTDRLTD